MRNDYVLTVKVEKQVAEKYNLVFKSEATVLEELSFFKKAIQTGDISYDLPIPATFIIDENMTIRYAYANADYRKRAEPKEVLEALKGF